MKITLKESISFLKTDEGVFPVNCLPLNLGGNNPKTLDEKVYLIGLAQTYRDGQSASEVRVGLADLADCIAINASRVASFKGKNIYHLPHYKLSIQHKWTKILAPEGTNLKLNHQERCIRKELFAMQPITSDKNENVSRVNLPSKTPSASSLKGLNLLMAFFSGIF